MAAAGDFATGFADLGLAVTDLFGSRGAKSSAGSYDEAARIAKENALLTQAATRTKALLLQRQITRSLGSTQAAVAGAGFQASGSALDIMRSSAEEGAVTKALNEEQGAISVNSYLAQSQQFSAMAKAARSSATGQTIGGLLSLGGAIGNFASGASSIFPGAGAAGAAAIPGSAGAGDLIAGAAVLA